MLVYVLNQNGQPLMPTHNGAKVRVLLKQKRARVVSKCPFTIRLLYESTNFTQPITLGVDTGSKYVGRDGEVDDEILALSATEDDSFVFGYTEVDGNKTFHGDYNLVKHLNWLLRKLKDSKFFQCSTENLNDLVVNVNPMDVDFKHPEYSVMEF